MLSLGLVRVTAIYRSTHWAIADEIRTGAYFCLMTVLE